MVDPSGTDNFSVSVIIPTFNRVEYLPDALDSVYSQTHPVTEVIVVDDGSTDHTVEKLSPAYPSVQFLRQKTRESLPPVILVLLRPRIHGLHYSIQMTDGLQKNWTDKLIIFLKTLHSGQCIRERNGSVMEKR